MILRPDAFVAPGASLRQGFEICIAEDRIAEIRPWTSSSRKESGLILSPAFVNAHSHLEYYDLKGKWLGLSYWPWIKEITLTKASRNFDDVQKAANLAAQLNVASGVAALGEYSDWPVSAHAMALAGLRGRIYQEVITLKEWESPIQKLSAIEARAQQQSSYGIPVHLSAHAPYTVSEDVLRQLSASADYNAIHVGETESENEFFQEGKGIIAEIYKDSGVPFAARGMSALGYLESLGCLHGKTQVVHACAFSDVDIEIAARTGISVAHCPRSNVALRCPPAPIAKMRAKGIKVGLGMDSAASSGEINMFDEMRAAIHVSKQSAEEVWQMATTEGAATIGMGDQWKIAEGANPDMILLRGGESLNEVIQNGSAASVVGMVRLGER